jgi:hypothetical protein
MLTNHLEEMMLTKILAGAAVIALSAAGSVSAEAQTRTSAAKWCRNHDGAVVDCREIRNDTREIRSGRREILADRREIHRDVRKGDKREARQDTRELRSDRRDLRGDVRDRRRDVRDLRHR